MDQHTKLGSRLVEKYQSTFSSPPEWAYPLGPSIPFIGTHYESTSPRMAVYASAENLSRYEREPERIPDFIKDDRAWNRHRAAYVAGHDGFFPRVHIAPVNDGSLLCAATFIRMKLELEVFHEPTDLLERLVVANLGKFSVSGTTNRDYAGNREFLRASLPFFKLDLEILQPDLLVLPKTMFDHQEVEHTVRESVPDCKVIPIYQFNSQVLNLQLKNQDKSAAVLREGLAGTILSHWTDMLKGYRKGYPYRYYAHLESVLDSS